VLDSDPIVLASVCQGLAKRRDVAKRRRTHSLARLSSGAAGYGLAATLAIFRPSWVPALPQEALIYKETDGASGHKSLLVLMTIAVTAAFAWASLHDSIVNLLAGSESKAPMDEILTLSMTAAAFLMLALALANRWLRLRLLSQLTERVEEEDPMDAVRRAIEQDAKKK
jgi:hypothetical protein